ncbi:hypothetical protein ACVW0Y_003591 [Pseudomonas sp. TE3786]
MQRPSDNAHLVPSPRLLSFTGSALLLLYGLGAQPDFPARLCDWLNCGQHFLLSLF